MATATAKKVKVSVEKSNAKFKKMTPKQKRVAIAEDVISSLKAKKFKATCGTYAVIDLKPDKQLEKLLSSGEPVADMELQDVLSKRMRSCNVCAKGAMFVAAVQQFDKLKVETEDLQYGFKNYNENYNDNEVVCDHLTAFFSQEQLDLIELAFEGTENIPYSYDGDAEQEQQYVASMYRHRYPDAKARMIAIMSNIIENDGEFVCRVKI